MSPNIPERRQKTLQGKTMTPGKDNELHPSKMTERAECSGRLFEWLFSILRKLELSLIEVLPVSWTHG